MEREQTPRRRRPACRECRVQKIRCNADPPEPCARCRRMGLTCLIAPTPKARHTKAQLQRELEAARTSRSTAPGDDSPADAGTESLSNVAGIAPISIPRDVSSSSFELVHSSTIGNVRQQPAIDLDSGGDAPAALVRSAQCSSQLLDGQEISPLRIRECFERFFNFYSEYAPFLGESTTPDDVFILSPFLFWTIVYLGSRYSPHDPTLLGQLSPKMNSMALQALAGPRTQAVQTIQGILLLCLWPVPVNTMHRDISLVLAGSALHLAMQVGLHASHGGAANDFSRTVIVRNSAARERNADLWRICCAVCFSAGLRTGVMPLSLNDISIWTDSGQGSAQLTAKAKFQQQVHAIVMTATASLAKIDLAKLQSSRDESQDAALLSLANLFDAQLMRLDNLAQTAADSTYLHGHRLYILAYNFFVNPASRQLQNFITIHAAACKVIRDACSRESGNRSGEPIAKHVPAVIESSVILAAMSILKIQSNEEISRHLDLEAGQAAFFSAIVTLRELSLQNDDLSSRSATILGNLWNSKEVFKKKNGQVDSLACRVRNRLSMGVVFDCLWWWRQEFAGQRDPYHEEPSRMQTRCTSPTAQADSSHGQGLLPQTSGAVLPDPLVANSSADDHELDASDDLIQNFDWVSNFDFYELMQ